ncbi:MAG TPA: hypothetical protein VHN14_18550 [Kofleriaceae bacterium]|nr:hypothetical protein [Kofleriaceae bacterium]
MASDAAAGLELGDPGLGREEPEARPEQRLGVVPQAADRDRVLAERLVLVVELERALERGVEVGRLTR